MINVSAAWLLALCLQAACSQTTNLNFPPEDLDSSGDDDDTFSGSGAGPLTDHSVAAWNVSLEHADSSRSAISTEATVHQPAIPSTENPAEKEMVSSPPASDVVPGEAVLSKEEETYVLGSADEKPTIQQPVTTSRSPTTIQQPVTTSRSPTTIQQPVTTSRSPTTHRPALRVTTSQASGIVHITEPGIQGSGPSDVSKETLNPDFATLSEDDVDSPTTIPPRDIDPIYDKEILSPEESSGDQGDFIFTEEPIILQDSELVDSSRDAEAAGTSQGLMNKKEVLGGVIAGGLIGLLFAVFLVGFMLYRMKKKDEGSYSLDEPKQSNGGYQKPQKQEEFYA